MGRTKGVVKRGLTELGVTGRKIFGGMVSEEFLPQLSGMRGTKVFREMSDNDPVVGSMLFAIDKLLRNVDWPIVPANETSEAKNAAKFLEECKDDMEHTWEEFLAEVLSFLPYGYSVHETVYKVRGGYDTENLEKKSKYNDNKVGWRKLPIRAQDTIWRWNLDPENPNYIVSVDQLPPLGGMITIPFEKVLLFRTESKKDNPQGRSVLRNAYRPWYFKKRIEEIEGIGIERDLAGLPVAWVPPNMLLPNANADEKAALTAIKKSVTSIRRDEQEGIVWPLVFDERGNKLYDLTLLTTGGSRQFDTSKIIDRYDRRIAMTVLADFILLGQSKVGSFALSTDKTDLFSLVITSWLDCIAGELNKRAVPKLMKLNGISMENCPKFKPGSVEKEDVKTFIDSVWKLANIPGVLDADDELRAKVRKVLDIAAPSKPGDGRVKAAIKVPKRGDVQDEGDVNKIIEMFKTIAEQWEQEDVKVVRKGRRTR